MGFETPESCREMMVGMLTPGEAEQRLRDHFREHPPALRGTLHFSGGWSEDDRDYVIGWGAREFEVDAITLVMQGARVTWNRSGVPVVTYESIASIFAERGVAVPR